MLVDTRFLVFGSTNCSASFTVSVYDLGTALTCWVNQVFLTLWFSATYDLLLIPDKWSVARHCMAPFFKYSLSLSTVSEEVLILSSYATIFPAASVAPGLSPAASHTSTRALNCLLLSSSDSVLCWKHSIILRYASTNSSMEYLLPSFWKVILCSHCTN